MLGLFIAPFMNHIKALIYSATILFVMPTALFARIGETFEQCITRYGNGTEVPPGYYRFTKNGFEVSVHFNNGKADSISYTGAKPFSEAQIQQLLAINAPEKKWKITGIQGGAPTLPASFQSEDGELVAYVGGLLEAG